MKAMSDLCPTRRRKEEEKKRKEQKRKEQNRTGRVRLPISSF
jgi:hypothetical protein